MAPLTTDGMTVEYWLRISISGMGDVRRSIRMAEQTDFDDGAVKLRIGGFKSGGKIPDPFVRVPGNRRHE